MARTMPNPVWVKSGATTPRNYQPTKHTSDDNHRMYARAAQRTGKTIGDIMAECRMEELLRREIYIKRD